VLFCSVFLLFDRLSLRLSYYLFLSILGYTNKGQEVYPPALSAHVISLLLFAPPCCL
jgi:hypothetical protein